MTDVVVAFQGWNNPAQGWNTGTWNTNFPYPVTATGSVGASTVSSSANVTVTGVGGTAAIGAVTTTGSANVTVTGVSGTAALGSFFTTSTMVTMTSAIGSTTTSGDANVTVTGLSATGEIGILQQPWGQIIPSQTPSWTEIAA